jgi:hypothetical protein
MAISPETVVAINRLRDLREQVTKGLQHVGRFNELLNSLMLAQMPDAAEGASAEVESQIVKLAEDVEKIPVLKREKREDGPQADK